MGQAEYLEEALRQADQVRQVYRRESTARFLRRTLKVRVSGERLAKIADKIWAARDGEKP